MTFIKQISFHTGIGGLFLGLTALLALGFGSFAIVHAQVVPSVTLDSIISQTVLVGDMVSFTASASASDASSTVSYGLSGEPSGAAIDTSSGAFLWDTTGAATGTYPFVVTASGSTGGDDSEDVSITVEVPQIVSDNSEDGTGGTATTTGGTIQTGDATATTSVSNTLNTNSINPDQPGQEMNSSTFTAAADNFGVLGSAATSTAMTGENEVIGGAGANLIVTGNAVSTANVINEVNTNIFNSDGLILFLNQLFGHGIDLSEYDLSYFFVGGAGSSPTTLPGTTTPQCTLLTCLNSSSLNVWNSNQAAVTNSVIVRSATGENVASSTGDATIDTGDAYAAANVVNLVNTNIINSSYLLVAYNNFGDLDSNIKLPNADFFARLFQTGAASTSMNASTYQVVGVNDINLTGTTTALANTGENIASTTLEVFDASSTPSTPPTSGAGVVTTGDAYAAAHTYNQANTNNVGGTSVFMLFRVSGAWSGNVVGLPAGLTLTTLQSGGDTLIKLVSENGTTTPTAAKLLEEYNSSHFSAIATSSADIENNIDVSADTGRNLAVTQNGTSTVNTGNAYASANVVNLVNTNIVGQNWIFGVFNIFGDMSGDIVFGGSAILTVGASPSRSEVAPGSDVDYTFTVQNTGSSDASDVIVNASFDNTLLSFSGGDVDMTPTATGASWDLGRVRHGETRTFTVTAHVGTNFPAGESASVRFTAAAVNDSITNPSASETVSAPIVVTSPAPTTTTTTTSGGGGGGGGGGSSSGSGSREGEEDPEISVSKTAALATSTAGVDYKVDVYNKAYAGPAYAAVLSDTLYDPKGAVVYTRSWNLATIVPGDEIHLTYTVNFASTTIPGTYKNVARVTGKRNLESSSAPAMKPVEASASIRYGSGRVLGIATSALGAASSTLAATAASTTPQVCVPYLFAPLRPGSSNGIGNVMKLQQFLNADADTRVSISGMGAPGQETDSFGPKTVAAVKRFQAKYAAEILAPLGLSQPSGFVYASTLRKINALKCGGAPVSVPAPVATPVVVGASCSIASSMRQGNGNSPSDVIKLQQFLNESMGEHLPTTGHFGSLTASAVKRFQVKYAAEILTPLGLSQPSGFVYSSTLRKINAVKCGNS